MGKFDGKVLAVAGGTSGINLGVAKHFAAEGAKVFTFSRDPEKVEAAVEALRAIGPAAEGMSVDVRDYASVEAAFARCAEVFGPIDTLLSGAAGNFVAKAADISSNGFRAVMEIDLLGTHHVMRAAGPHLRRPGANIINVTAPQAQVAMVGQAHVCAAKAGVDMLTRAYALEWGPEGIRVNAVSPGPIADTEGVRRLMSAERLAQNEQSHIPLRRMGVIEDVAELCAFLASDAASWITGTVIPVDGGLLLNPTPHRMAEMLEG
ncbi:SDR family oxidoreductase [Rhodovulum sp. DZ06]|uniref:SDR family oxidoreductase n=1 Tax=Rhodovulum sp. DZ06 TaxID=3425126 RepID=UPI003D32DB2B